MKIVPDMVGIVVGDLAASVRFYRLLGLAFPDPPAGSPYVEVKANGYRISLNAESMVREIDPAWEEPRGQRLDIAFLCESPAHVDAAYAAVLAAGYAGHKEPWDAPWGQRYAIVRDPDGTHLSLFAPLAG
jgi:catechol 2,3-dioxygenase-like lactoylglutathione lyase family enzyme